jgi:hypothetical protein
MSRPIAERSHDGATSTGPGEELRTGGHGTVGLYVVAVGLDPGSDTLDVRVEGSMSQEHYAPLNSGAPATSNSVSVSVDDFVQSEEDGNVYVAFVSDHNFPIDSIRANITSYSSTGGAEVSTYVSTSGWNGPRYSFQSDLYPYEERT